MSNDKPKDRLTTDIRKLRKITTGSSNSNVSFIQGEIDELTQEIEDEIEGDFEPEIEDLEDDSELEEIEIPKPIKKSSGSVTSPTKVLKLDIDKIRKKPKESDLPKLPEIKPEEKVADILNEISEEISEEEIEEFFDVSPEQKEELLVGELDFLARKNSKREDRFELFSKLDEIVPSPDVTRTNAIFVLKWLKKGR